MKSNDGHYEVQWPRSPRQVKGKKLARRLDTLNGKTIAQFWDFIFSGDKVFEALEDYAWPGNIRELRNTVERMAILTRGDVLDLDRADRAIVRDAARVAFAVDPLDASVLTCAGVTTYKAVKVSGARPGQLVAVFGVGGLGHLALQYAKISGASVVAVDVPEDPP